MRTPAQLADFIGDGQSSRSQDLLSRSDSSSGGSRHPGYGFLPVQRVDLATITAAAGHRQEAAWILRTDASSLPRSLGRGCTSRSRPGLSLGHILREWLEKPHGGPAAPESAPEQVWYSTPGASGSRVVVWLPSVPSRCSPGCLGGLGLRPQERLVHDRSSPAAAGWVAEARTVTR
jgi:hypothetical protein